MTVSRSSSADSASTRVFGEQRLMPRAALAPPPGMRTPSTATVGFSRIDDENRLGGVADRVGELERRLGAHEARKLVARGGVVLRDEHADAPGAHAVSPAGTVPGACGSQAVTVVPTPGEDSTRSAAAAELRTSPHGRKAGARRTGFRKLRIESAAVVGDDHGSAAVALEQRDGHARSRGVHAHVLERFLGDAEEHRRDLGRRLCAQLVGEAVVDSRAALGIDRERKRDGEALLLESGWVQLDDEVAQASDRQLHRLLGLRHERELLGLRERAPQHLQAHCQSGHGLNGIVVNALGETPALLLAGRDELGQQLAPLRAGGPGDGSGLSRRSRGRRSEGAVLHARATLPCG